MTLCQFLNQRQPNTAALVGAAARPFDPVEAFNQVRDVVFRNAGSGVPHRNRQAHRAPTGRNETSISPSNVNLNAFETKFRTIFSHISRST